MLKSIIRILLSKDGYNELKAFVDAYYDKYKDDPSIKNKLNETDIYEVKDTFVYLGWNDIDWSFIGEAEAVFEGLIHLKKNGYSYSLSEVKEKTSNVDTITVDGKNDYVLKPINIQITIDDSAIIESL